MKIILTFKMEHLNVIYLLWYQYSVKCQHKL